MRAALVLLMFTPWLFGAPIPKDRRKQADAELIQGRWQVVKRLDDGVVRGEGLPERCFWVFTDKNLRIDQGELQVFIMDSKASPKRLDLKSTHGYYNGLYELDGDTLKWHNTGPGGAVPTEIGGKGFLIIFQRVKEK